MWMKTTVLHQTDVSVCVFRDSTNIVCLGITSLPNVYHWDMMVKYAQNAQWYFDQDDSHSNKVTDEEHSLNCHFHGFYNIHGKDSITDAQFKDLLLDLMDNKGEVSSKDCSCCSNLVLYSGNILFPSWCRKGML